MAHRILLVEDDLHTRRILKTLLMTESTLAKAELLEASDGRAALGYLDTGKIHLIVTDLMMPGMDGVEFCHHVRQHPMGQHIPILMTSSAVKATADVDKLKTLFNAEFFAKPFEVRAIVRAMLRALSEGFRAAPKSAPAPAPSSPARPSPQSAPSEAVQKKIVAAARVGKLSNESPAALLLDACEQRTTGTLVLLRGNMQKQIALRLGAPVSVDSNLRNETLGHYLVSRGVLDDARHQEALAMARENRIQLGQALIQKGWMTESELLRHLGAQMKTKLISTLRWRDGDWQLFVGEPASRGMELPIDTPSVVFTGLQRSAHIDEIAPRFMTHNGRVRLLPRGERFSEDFERVFGAGSIATLTQAPSFQALMTTGDPVAILVQLDTLLSCQLAQLDEAPVAQPPIAQAPAPAFSETPSLAQVAQPAPSESLYDQLFEDKTPPVAETTDSQEIEALRREIATVFVDVHRKSLYAVLGVAQTARADEIAAAYEQLRRTFNLERVAGKDLGPDYARLEEILSIQQRAFETLSSPELRAAYDETLQPRARAAAPRIDADLLAQEASRLISDGDAAGAVQKLAHAVALAPTEADYQALLAWATFDAKGRDQEAFRLAQVHTQAALRINPDNALAHEYLGRMYVALGDKLRAFDSLGRAIDLDPLSTSALGAFEAFAAQTQDHQRLELRYRKILHRLSDETTLKHQLELWLRLGDLYFDKLSDPESGRMAYSMVHELAPNDPRPRERLAARSG